ncbi:DUF6053 domain-containing protein [Lysobacter enzymogenes]|uniref:DUF6053 domain-containing protein n=1 Tax=Lysobacter enzymogenes TaxID=69 RepID=UPI003D18A286
MGGASAPMLSAQVAATGSESIGPEGPPTVGGPVPLHSARNSRTISMRPTTVGGASAPTLSFQLAAT